ncbi:MAG: toll/interleukin-1 receptor domain-containing protein [Pseudoalteromonas distincta]
MFIDLKLKNFFGYESKWTPDQVKSYKERERKALVSLEGYLLDGSNILDADEIQKSVFPERDIDVFISHSHADEGEAIKVALSLEEIGLKPFVDSCTWGYADELLQKIDDVFSKTEGGGYYNYKIRNRTTTNVHLILNTALQQMIHRSELFVFLETDNSVKIGEHISKNKQLSSPWIFSELSFAQCVERTPRKRVTLSNEGFTFDATASDQKLVEFRYPLPASTYSMEFLEFEKWLDDHGALSILNESDHNTRGLQHLDNLYRELKVASRLLEDPRVLSVADQIAAKSRI